MTFSSNVCRFALFSFLSLSANADTDSVRGVQRRLESEVDLRTAGDYVILAKTGIDTVPTSAITGNIAVSPIAATAITGFDLILSSDGKSATSTQVIGVATAASYLGDTPALLTTAVSDMQTAYTDAAGRDNEVAARIDLGNGLLGGAGNKGGVDFPLTPGVYTFGSDVLLSGDINFHGSDTDTDIFIIQMTGNLVQAAS
jgi:hypothetical protein